jgi:transcription elongation factor GreA
MPNNELTEVEIKTIKDEINHRQTVLTPKYIAEVQRTRAFGDLSENDEYRSAKRELNRNYSRIRYLKAMLENAVLVNYESDEDKVGIFDHVTLWNEDDEEELTITIVTPLRHDILNNRISKDSPLALAILGHKEGERVLVKVNDKYSYYVVIRDIIKGEDDDSIRIH